MTLRKGLSALAATGLLMGATGAVAADGIRQAAPISDSEGLVGGGGAVGWVIAALVAAGIVLVIVEDDANEAPASP